MKKLIFLLALLILPLITYSQQTALIYHCIKVAVQDRSTEEWSEQQTDYFIKVDIKNNIITFDNVGKSKYYIRYELEQISGVDADGDKYLNSSFSAYDEEGINCVFIIVNYTEINLTAFFAYYTDVAYQWQATSTE